MRYTITPEEMRRVERAAFARGVPPLLLMENAARAVVEALRASLSPAQDAPVLFACGGGNNGGDALAAARLYTLAGGRAAVWLPWGAKTPEAQANLAYLRACAPAMLREDETPPVGTFAAAVDGLIGTGLRGAPDARAGAAIAAVNACPHVLAIDTPSGLDALSGAAEGACVRAEVTVALHRVKQGLYLTRRRDWVGTIRIADIGLPAALDDAPGFSVDEAGDLRALLPARALTAHKGDCGRARLLAGSEGMAGAAVFAASAALRAGTGLVTVLCPAETLPVVQSCVPSALCRALPLRTPPEASAQLLGCGLAETEDSWREILRLHADGLPTVWDAGALNLLARHPQALREADVITPHPGEAARLLDWPVARVLDDLPGAAQALRARYGCAVLLKSSVSVLLPFAGERRALHVLGTPALAKGGSGDALAGLLTGLLAQGMPAFDAMRLACLWHGLAARSAARAHGVLSALTAEVIDALGAVAAQEGR